MISEGVEINCFVYIRFISEAKFKGNPSSNLISFYILWMIADFSRQRSLFQFHILFSCFCSGGFMELRCFMLWVFVWKTAIRNTKSRRNLQTDFECKFFILSQRFYFMQQPKHCLNFYYCIDFYMLSLLNCSIWRKLKIWRAYITTTGFGKLQLQIK